MIRKSPMPLFSKEGHASLWEREAGGIFDMIVLIL